MVARIFLLQPILLLVPRARAFILAACGVELVAHGEANFAAVAPADLLGLDSIKMG